MGDVDDNTSVILILPGFLFVSDNHFSSVIDEFDFVFTTPVYLTSNSCPSHDDLNGSQKLINILPRRH